MAFVPNESEPGQKRSARLLHWAPPLSTVRRMTLRPTPNSRMPALLLGILLGFCAALAPAQARDEPLPAVGLRTLPPEASQTLRLIEQGGPFPYRKDGSTFGNREQRLPPRSHGCYREYTVPTPDSRDRGARRIIAACDGPRYYSADHYRSFRSIQP